MSDAALEARNVYVRYGGLPAVVDADLRVERGEVVALIGETGSGKSSLAFAVARLLPPGTYATGSIEIGGREIVGLVPSQMRALRGASIGYIAQDSMAALNPTTRVGWQIAEAFRIHENVGRRQSWARTVDALRRVRIAQPAEVARLYPHQLSGGMRQRVMIAMALALLPALVVADEPTTALDVSTQAEILELVMSLRTETGAGILWITHDMGVVAELADRVAVMYGGRIVEQGTAEQVFDAPLHPYSDALLKTLRDLRRGAPGSAMFQIEGQPPSLSQTISGCAFHPRCPHADERCVVEDPPVEASETRRVACHHPLVVAAVP